ncbi:oxalate/formate MFS antiporter [Chelatococcus sambhunathii]|uniref:Oxalate/formate MFS antiporter n=1 Tax=Chelatococcus sambhunathii TaxID=363953 RepID=A0ABU1DKB7_9HYPH|nr:oxalate/formate MFS antiporter [Chelatococcus sambhunathii]MDR4308404.1 oxalate/formate MFS antiporter [Chelatococcus sambhunathii]
MTATIEAGAAPAVNRTRWAQLALGVVAMMAISSPQYIWTLFTKPLMGQLGTTLPDLQVTFSILIVLQTWLSPAQGALVERFGPRLLVALGCALSGASWVLTAYATSLPAVYLFYGVLGGIGTGIVYIGIIGQMVKWFPDRRGFATGMAAAGYGFGAIFLNFPISSSLATAGLQHTLIVFGLMQGAVGVAAALMLKAAPESGAAATPAAPVGALRTRRDYTWREMLKTPVFWLMFAMMTMMSTGGLMVISQFATFSRSFGIDEKVLVLGFAALPLALTIDRITNGLTRPIFGFVSDRIGREKTMAIAFIGEGIAIAGLVAVRDDPLLYVLMSGVVFFGWGEIFSLFPSTLTDTFGETHATKNYGFLYMAQGVGSVLGGPIAAWIFSQTGSWMPVFGAIIAMDVLTGLLALFALAPMRRRLIEQAEDAPAGTPALA